MTKNEILSTLENIQKNGVTVNNFVALEKIIEDIKNEIRRDNNKKSGAINIEKSAKNVIKSAKKNQPGNKMLHGAWTKNGRQYVCDGYRALQILDPIELEEVDLEKGNPIDCEKYFASLDNFSEEFALPAAAELKNMIQAAKADAKLNGMKNSKIVYACENGPVLNADYLLDAITATGAGSLKTEKHYRTQKYVSPCVMHSEKCNAVLLPVNSPIVGKNECFAV